MAQIPKVSIGIPVYNGAKHLATAIESILQQTYADFELIISDNASTDETSDICLEFARRDSRIAYSRLEENCGAAGNFNRLVHLARGEYFKWAAADDYCSPDFLERLVEVLDSQPNIAWAHTRSELVDEHGKILPLKKPKEFGTTHSQQAGLPRQFHDSDDRVQRFQGVLLGSRWCADSFGLFRKDLLLQTRLELPIYGSEKIIIGHMSLLGKYFEYPAPLFFQRVHPGDSTNQNNASLQAWFVTNRKKALSFTRTRLLLGHLDAVQQAPLDRRDRIRCYGVLLQYLGQFRKWGRITKSILLGKGVSHDATQT